MPVEIGRFHGPVWIHRCFVQTEIRGNPADSVDCEQSIRLRGQP
jgi:hypothetical protein